MEPVLVLRIVVASPGDVQAERDALPAVLEESIVASPPRTACGSN